VQAFLAEHADFTLLSELATAPPTQGEDAHAAFVMRRA